MAIVQGAQGIGKTRLVEEFATRWDRAGRRLLVGRCRRLNQPLPFGVVVEALLALQDDAGRALPPRTAALSDLLPELGGGPYAPRPGGPARIARHLVFRAVARLLRALGPTALVLEDLQWVDAFSAELLRYLVEDPPAELVLVTTCRGDGRGAPLSPPSLVARAGRGVGRARVDLGPLDPISVRALAATHLHLAVAPNRLAVHLHALTGGVPGAVEELIRFAVQQGALLPTGRAPSWLRLEQLGVPPAVHDAAVAELDLLGPGRPVVEASAVLEEPASEQRLASVAALAHERAERAIDDALRTGVLVEVAAGAFALRHPLAARAVAATLPGPVRRRLHRRAASQLEREKPRPLARLARHYRECGESSLWRRCAERAAGRARSAGDAETAVRLLHDALTCSDLTRAVRLRLVRKLAAAALDCGGLGQPEAIRQLHEALGASDLPAAARADLLVLAGNLQGWTDDAVAGRHALREALAGGADAARDVRVMACLGSAPTTPASERTRWLDRAADVAASLGQPTENREILPSRAHVLLHVGDRSGWRVAARLPADAHRTGRDTLRQLRIAWACLYLGHYARAQSRVDAIARDRRRLTDRLALDCEALKLVLRWVRGDWEGLETEATALTADAADVVSATVAAAHVAGLLMLARGALDESEPVLRSCVERGARAGLHRSVAAAAAGLARILLRRRRPHAAWAEATAALDLITAEGLWSPAAELVPSAVAAGIAAGRVAEVDTLLREFAMGLRGRDSPVGRATLALSRGLLTEARGDGLRARRCLLLARRLFAALPAPYMAARVTVLVGMSLLRSADVAGRTIVIDGIAALDALGATGDADEARRALRRAGVPVRSAASRGRRGYGADLSPREHQVAELARQALTNKEIASVLQISPRTVECHVAAIVRKTRADGKRGLRGGTRGADSRAPGNS